MHYQHLIKTAPCKGAPCGQPESVIAVGRPKRADETMHSAQRGRIDPQFYRPLRRKEDGRLRNIIEAIKLKHASYVPCAAAGGAILQLGIMVIGDVCGIRVSWPPGDDAAWWLDA